MPKTNEVAFNFPLLEVLRDKHPHWRDRTAAEQQGVLRETALRPDILIRPSGGVPVIIETEFEPARSVEADARARLGKHLQYNGDRIEQTIAVQVPRELSRAPQEDLARQIEATEFHYCTYSLQEADTPVRWPATGWLAGSIDDLATCIENVALSERLLAEGTQILEQSIGEAAGKLRETAGTHTLENMAQALHQEDSEQTSRMAMAIVANALVFHTAIVEAHEIATIDQLRIPGRSDVSKSRLLACWQHILDNINYYPIFHIASDLLRPIPDGTAHAVLNRLARAVSDLAGLGATTLHDLSGRMFQRLIADRKFLATLPYGQQSQEKRHAMALGALDLIEYDATPSLFGTGIHVAQGTGADVEAEGERGSGFQLHRSRPRQAQAGRHSRAGAAVGMCGRGFLG